MSEPDGSTTATAVGADAGREAGAPASPAGPAAVPAGGEPTPETTREPAPDGDPAGASPSGAPARPTVRARRSGPLTRMGPWAPLAGGLLGAVVGLVAALVLAGAAHDFRDRLALVFLVVGLGLLGASGTLLGDEVRLVRWRARQAAISPGWVEATAGLLNGLTPARLLLLVSGFVLFLSAYVAVR